MISFCSSFVALCGNFLACPFSLFSFIVSTYLDFSNGCFSNFCSSDNILEMVMFLLQGKIVLSSFHKSPTEYLPCFLDVVDSRF